MRLINADKYMAHLRANIDTTADIVDEQIKKDEPIGTVKDGGQIGYLLALQWARSSLKQDCYTVKAIPLDEIKQVRKEIGNRTTYDGIYIDRADVLSILDNLIKRNEVKE